jgi:hypothetical protein
MIPPYSGSLPYADLMLFLELPKHLYSYYSLVTEYSCVLFAYFTFKLWTVD